MLVVCSQNAADDINWIKVDTEENEAVIKIVYGGGYAIDFRTIGQGQPVLRRA